MSYARIAMLSGVLAVSQPVSATNLGEYERAAEVAQGVDEKIRLLSEALRAWRPQAGAEAKSRIHVLRADQYRETDRLDLSLADYNEAIRLGPDDARKRFGRGTLLWRLGKFGLAIKDLSLVIDSDPNNPNSADIYASRAICYDHVGKYDLALRDYNRAIKLSPSDVELYSGRSRTHALMRQHDRALADINRAIQLDPASGGLFGNRGTLHELTGRDALAIADYNTAIRLAPNEPDRYAQRAEYWIIQKSWKQAEEDLGKAFTLDRNNAGAHCGAAFLYWGSQKSKERALRHIDLCLKNGMNDFEDFWRETNVQTGTKGSAGLLRGLNDKAEFKAVVDKYRRRQP